MRLFTIAMHEIRMNFSQKSIIFVIFVMPLILIFVLGSSLSGMSSFKQSNSTLEQVTAGVVIQGTSPIHQAFETWMQHDSIQPYVEFKRYEREAELRRDVQNQVVEYGVILPEQTQMKDVFTLVGIRGIQMMSNLTMETMLESFNTETGITITAMKQSAALPASANMKANGEASIVRLNQSKEQMVSAMQYYAVAMLIMYLMYTGRGLADSLYHDRMNQTLHRTMASPIRMFDFVGGRVLGHFIFGMLQTVLVVVFTTYVYGVDWGTSALVTYGVCALVLICSLCFGLLSAAWFTTQKAMKTFMESLIVFMTAVSGGFFVIPALKESVGIFTLPYWAMESLTGMMTGSSWNDVAMELGILGAIALVLSICSLLFVRKAVLR